VRSLERVAQVLDRRLLTDCPRPLVVALSGGGDSLALTLIADAWARRASRPLLILTVDHRLQAASADWTEACAALARRLERPFRALAWTGDKPTSGLPAAARRARHALLAEAARDAGARVLMMGHTADDLGEAAAMRAAGATTPDPREWAPSPVWPEGRGLFVLRPLLGASRGELRAWLAERGEVWIEDPANADPRYARSRARLAGAASAPAAAQPAPLALAALVSEHAGVLSIPRGRLRSADAADAVRLLGLACVCAGGGERRPLGPKLARLADRVRDPNDIFVATLAGARVEAEAAQVRIFREAGEAARGGWRSYRSAAQPAVWDGRFEVAALAEAITALSGLAGRLPPKQQAALKTLPAAARKGLPAVVGPEGSVDCPVFSGAAHSLVLERLRAAAGLVGSEPPYAPAVSTCSTPRTMASE
jgi:tRNA(Ile)-lysidine synthase